MAALSCEQRAMPQPGHRLLLPPMVQHQVERQLQRRYRRSLPGARGRARVGTIRARVWHGGCIFAPSGSAAGLLTRIRALALCSVYWLVVSVGHTEGAKMRRRHRCRPVVVPTLTCESGGAASTRRRERADAAPTPSLSNDPLVRIIGTRYESIATLISERPGGHGAPLRIRTVRADRLGAAQDFFPSTSTPDFGLSELSRRSRTDRRPKR